KTRHDDELEDKEEFRLLVDKQHREWLARNPGADESFSRPEIEHILRTQQYQFEISAALRTQIGRTLVPFSFQNQLSGAVLADSKPKYPLPSVTNLLPASEHKTQIALVRNSSGELPILWYGAFTGLMTPSYLKELEDIGVRASEYDFSGDGVKTL